MPAPVITVDPLFVDAGDAERLVELAHRFGRYRIYGEAEHVDLDVGRGLLPRQDSVQHFVRTGGARGPGADPSTLAARTSYFREEYAYDGREQIGGVESFLHNAGLIEAAAALHDRPIVEPAIAFANLMVPGQELAVHTDVPEFRGASRKNVPQWLLVVMHHSGLFDAWRLPIATGISYFLDSDGGACGTGPTGPAPTRWCSPSAPTRAWSSTPTRSSTAWTLWGPAPTRQAGHRLHAGRRARRLLGPAPTRRRADRALRLGRAAFLGLVEGLLLRRRSRARHLAGPRRRPHDRCHHRAAGGRPRGP